MEKNIEEELRALRREVEELSRSIKEMKEQSVEENVLTGVQRRILQLLAEENKPFTVREISDLAERAETTVSGYLRELYKGGYLQRRSKLVEVGESRKVRQWEYWVPQEKKRKWQYL